MEKIRENKRGKFGIKFYTKVLLCIIMLSICVYGGVMSDVFNIPTYDGVPLCLSNGSIFTGNVSFNKNSLNNISSIEIFDKIVMYSPDNNSWNITIGNDGSFSNIETELIGVYANLLSQNSTTITVAGTYYPVNGIFNNTPMEGFFYNMTANAIQYNSTTPRYIEIYLIASISGDSNGITSEVGVSLNGIELDRSDMPVFMKTLDESFTAQTSTVVYLEQGDKLQLVVTSDGNGDIITFNKMTVILDKFFE